MPISLIVKKSDLKIGKAIIFLLIFCLFFLDPACHAQTKVRVSDPKLELKDNIIHIYYDILNSNPDEKYIISINIRDEDGSPVDAHSFVGDIGIVEEGGTNKQITWNLEADNIFMDAYVFVQINAKVISPPEPVTTEPEEEVTHEVVEEKADIQTKAQAEEIKEKDVIVEDKTEPAKPEEEIETEELPPLTKTTKEFNRTEVVIQSLALPGLGLSRITGQPHWIRGVTGYGCIAGAIILNRTAINTFNNIGSLFYFDEINRAYDKSTRQGITSKVLGYTAVGIWVTDFIWNLAGTTDLKRRTSTSQGFSFETNIDPLSYVPMVSVKYRF